MKEERQRGLIERFLSFRKGEWTDIASASMRNPADAYADPRRFEVEMGTLFRNFPTLVGLSCECSEPGSYVTATLGGVPVAVVRQADGSLRGFVNSCRHRGAPLLCGNGGGLRAMVCPYHAWSYGLDGSLLSRPQEWGFADVPPGECSLLQISVAEKYGLVYARPSAGAALSLDTVLEGMEEEISEYRLAGYTHFETRAREWNFNWKLVIDTFTESYHIPALHRKSIAPHYYDRYSVWDTYGRLHQRTVNFRKSIDKEIAENDQQSRRLLPHTTIEYFLFPNAILTHQLDHVELWRVTPLAVNSCLVSTSLYVADPPATDSATRHWQKNLDALMGVTESEDFPMMENIHAALASGALKELVYGRNEPALSFFHGAINHVIGVAPRG